MIRKYLILFIIFHNGAVPAADSLGRLFLTPAQRAQLDTARAQRDRRLPVTVETEAAPAPAPVPQGPDVVTYNGMVRRSDGQSTVWINGKPMNERTRTKNDSEVTVLGVRRDGAVSVAIPQAGRTGSLKVGQSLEVTSGRIEESYSRRAALRDPAPPATPSAPAVARAAQRERVPLRAVNESDPDSGVPPPDERGTSK